MFLWEVTSSATSTRTRGRLAEGAALTRPAAMLAAAEAARSAVLESSVSEALRSYALRVDGAGELVIDAGTDRALDQIDQYERDALARFLDDASGARRCMLSGPGRRVAGRTLDNADPRWSETHAEADPYARLIRGYSGRQTWPEISAEVCHEDDGCQTTESPR